VSSIYCFALLIAFLLLGGVNHKNTSKPKLHYRKEYLCFVAYTQWSSKILQNN